eukprot:206437-Karenia_brevis.AAC.1
MSTTGGLPDHPNSPVLSEIGVAEESAEEVQVTVESKYAANMVAELGQSIGAGQGVDGAEQVVDRRSDEELAKIVALVFEQVAVKLLPQLQQAQSGSIKKEQSEDKKRA